jgi:hypothetical protein
MKSQKFNKALTLNKATVSNLNFNQMHEAKGGYFETAYKLSCHSYCDCKTIYIQCRQTLESICYTNCYTSCDAEC